MATAQTEAAHSNAELRVLAAHIATMSSGVPVARQYNFNPELNLTAGIDYHAGISHGIEWPGKRALREALAKHDVTAAEVALAGFKVALAAEVHATFIDLLAAQAARQLAGEEVQAASTLVEAARRRVVKNFAPASEELKAMVELINAQRQQQAAEKDIALAGLKLNALLGRASSAPTPEISGELMPKLTGPALENILAQALAQHPDLRAQQVEIERAATRVAVARKERAPDITVEAFYEQSSSDSSEKRPGIGLNIPLPLWKSGQAGVASAQAAKTETSLELEKKRRDISMRVTQAFVTWQAAQKDVALFAPEMPAKLDEQCRAAQARYAAGTLPLLALVDLQQTRRTHRRDYHAAVVALHRAWAELETAAGVPLEATK